MPASIPYSFKSKMQVYPQPIESRQAQLFGFILKGKVENLKKLCDDNFAGPSKGVCEYIPISPYVLLTFNRLPIIHHTKDSGFAYLGSIAEHEVAIWIMTARTERTDRGESATQLAWFVPYMFVNDSFALSAGREIFGLPKQWGWITFPENNLPLSPFSVDTVAISQFSPEAMASRQRLLEINRKDDASEPGPQIEKKWSSPLNALREIRAALANHEEPISPSFRLLPNLLNDLIHLELPMVALRQFPDIALSDDFFQLAPVVT